MRSLTELLHEAKLSWSEGRVEDAKSIYRSILKIDSKNVQAKKALRAIAEQEVETLFTELGEQESSDSESSSPTDEVVHRLSEELCLEEDLAGEEILFSEQGRPLSDCIDEYFKNIERQLTIQCPDLEKRISTMLDLGVAFLEMELFEVAIKCFERAEVLERIDQEDDTKDSTQSHIARYLLATSFLRKRDFFLSLIHI